MIVVTWIDGLPTIDNFVGTIFFRFSKYLKKNPLKFYLGQFRGKSYKIRHFKIILDYLTSILTFLEIIEIPTPGREIQI